MRRKAKTKQNGVPSNGSAPHAEPARVPIRQPDLAEVKLKFISELLPQLARAIGPLCELVLHEKQGKQFRIRAIANNHISNRAVGGPMGRIFVNSREITKPEGALFNYAGLTEDKKRLRCTLLPIHHDDKTIGLICVNFLTHDLQNAKEALSALLAYEPETQDVQEFVPTQGDILDGIMDHELRQRGRPAGALTKQEKLELLRTLRSRGALHVRGAIGRLAERLGVSRTAVYNYLREA